MARGDDTAKSMIEPPVFEPTFRHYPVLVLAPSELITLRAGQRVFTIYAKGQQLSHSLLAY